jgi:hypothetical protein
LLDKQCFSDVLASKSDLALFLQNYLYSFGVKRLSIQSGQQGFEPCAQSASILTQAVIVSANFLIKRATIFGFKGPNEGNSDHRSCRTVEALATVFPTIVNYDPRYNTDDQHVANQ